MRFEIKVCFAPHHAGTIDAWLAAHPDAFRSTFAPRRVNNVYFDTPDLQAFAENLAGVSRRCKVRLRWYGADDLPERGTLELKHKHGTLGWKDSFAIEAPYVSGDSWADVHRRIRAQLPRDVRREFDEHPRATLLNRYHRRYLESADRVLRVTLDTDQQMFDQTRARSPNLRRRSHIPDVHVLELKCEAEDRRRAVRALASCPVRVTRFSKYAIGVELR
ncbi:MAG: VTC domain-containing protein [Planctomycetes bacterium]|nr:VTC domain-containing protein [Planctomycetota bacterium]MCB9870525.1 VTC domain-containing protein [Planctomycetota bacterium]